MTIRELKDILDQEDFNDEDEIGVSIFHRGYDYMPGYVWPQTFEKGTDGELILIYED